jgi:hypothetical protein
MVINDPRDEERRKRIRHRNWALLAVLAALSVLFYLMTLVQFGGGGTGG